MPPLPATTHGSAPKLDELELLWDPLFEVSSRRWVGLTARLAWRRPGGALAGAADLWRAAARAGMVAAILRWQVRNALGDFLPRHSRSAGAGATHHSSRRRQPWRRRVSSARWSSCSRISAWRRSASALEIPVLVLERDVATVVARLRELAARAPPPRALRGRRGSLPLEPLTEIAWSGWKLDDFLVQQARLRPAMGALASGLLGMARQMNLVSVAEQVDDALDLTWLGLHRCDLAQGAALRRPVPADQLAAMIAELRKSV